MQEQENGASAAGDEPRSSMPAIVTVFGGTGFLGRRIVEGFLAAGSTVRVASRHPERAAGLFAGASGSVLPVRADITDGDDVRDAVAGADAVINAVSLYVERGSATFHTIHVEGAERVARQAAASRTKTLVHLSGIGADPHAADPYIASRGQGEDVVRRAFPAATVIRPSVMFGEGDAFVTKLAELLRRFPVFPLFGQGTTRLQPVHVVDVARAIRCIAEREDLQGRVHELGGPDILPFREVVTQIAIQVGARTKLLPVPLGIWRPLARVAELLPSAPVTRSQVAMMVEDNIAERTGTFAACGVTPARLRDVLADLHQKGKL